MNKYHKYINLPFEITKPPVIGTKPDHFFVPDDGWRCPHMEEFHEQLGLSVGAVEYLYTEPSGGKIPIHSDQMYFDNHVKINISYGPEDAKMIWWECAEEDSMPIQEFEIRLTTEPFCTKVWEANTNRPSLCNVGQPHSTFNPSHKERWTLCFIPSKNGKHIQWEDAIEYYGKYLQ